MARRSTFLVPIIKKAFRMRFALAKMTRLPLIGWILNKALFEGDRMVYLPMDRVVRVDRTLGQPIQSFLPSSVAEHFVRMARHRWIMDECICRSSNHCKDYPIGLGCLFLGEASSHISPGLGRPVSEEEALEHLRKCREAGLVHVIGRDRLDAVWLGVRPGHRLMTICNCCPCCCLWKMLPSLSPDIAARFTPLPGVAVSITDRCIGCGKCVDACFLGAIKVADGRAAIGEECRGCGRCADVCPRKAIEVSYDGRLDEAVSALTPYVDPS